ncbi:MAG TPA: hypothetical protein VF092_05115 [Longimicrobium sp.]
MATLSPAAAGTSALRLLTLALAAALSACTDEPFTSSVPASQPARPQLRAAASESESPYGCYISEAVRTPLYRYRYTRRELHFPATALAADGSTLKYRLRLQNPGEEPVYVANCLIPRTQTGVRFLEQWLRVPKDVRYTVTHTPDRTGTVTTMATSVNGDPCDSQVGDLYDENKTCFGLDEIIAISKPAPPPPPPPEPAPPPGETTIGTDTPGGGDGPCYTCEYNNSGTLACTASVQRGGTVSCSINTAKQGEANLVVHSWTFVDADGNTSQNLDPVVTWSGTAVVGGTVTVRFDDGSGAREIVSSFMVTDRGWSWARNAESVFSENTGVQCSYWGTPDQGGSNGINLPQGAASCAETKRFVQPDSYSPAGDGFVARTVQSGPNQGFHYIESARLNIKRESSVNVGLRPDAPQVPLLRLGLNQRSCSTNLINWYQFTLCQGVDPEGYIRGVHNHEGYGSTGHNGHYSAAYDAAVDPANDLMIYLDRMIGVNTINWGTFVEDVRRGFFPRAKMVDEATQDLLNGGTIVTGNYSGIYYGYYAREGTFLSHYRND